MGGYAAAGKRASRTKEEVLALHRAPKLAEEAVELGVLARRVEEAAGEGSLWTADVKLGECVESSAIDTDSFAAQDRLR